MKLAAQKFFLTTRTESVEWIFMYDGQHFDLKEVDKKGSGNKIQFRQMSFLKGQQKNLHQATH
jgi:hypothetical protein